MTDSVRFPVKVLVKQVTEAEVSLDKANLQRVPLNKGSLHMRRVWTKIALWLAKQVVISYNKI